VDGVYPLLASHANYAGYVQVCFDRLARLAHRVRLVGLHSVQRVAVLVRVDSDGTHAQFVPSPEHAYRYLAPVSRHYLAYSL